jgi:hypothetical protein
MLSSCLLDHVFVSHVSQTRDNKRGVKGSMLSSRLLDHAFVSEHAKFYTTFIFSGMNHTGHEHMI